MIIKAKSGNDDIANVYIGEINGKMIEMVESVQPPIPRDEKWVLIVSTMYGCPVKCTFCDCGSYYHGKIDKDGIFAQIDYLISTRYPDRKVPAQKFKIQFARMGEPALNPAVLQVLREFPSRYDASGFMPSFSTVAPRGIDKLMDELLEIKNELYPEKFQLQFSVHSTDSRQRDSIIPVRKWTLGQIADYGNKFFAGQGRKVTLNFAPAEDTIIEVDKVKSLFDPDVFFIKITPVNPTYNAVANGIKSYIYDENNNYELVDRFKKAGYDVLLSIGELEENKIGSNCGQHILNFRKRQATIANSYTYELKTI